MIDSWNDILSDLKKTLPSQTFETWIQPLVPVRKSEEGLVLGVPNRFFIDWLRNQNLVGPIADAAGRSAGRVVAIDFEVVRQKGLPLEEPRIDAPSSTGEDWRERSLRIGLNPRYTFDTFVVGPSNDFAHAASLAVAGGSPRTYNPLFIYGGVGLGKTHLLNAIGNQKIFLPSNLKVCYVHSENFMNELIQSLANKKMPEFRNRYRSMDVLLMDDIQFLSGKERTQEEFFHTFNSLYENGKSIVVTSDKFPKEIPDLEDRLRSRFEWGLIADIQPPDMETKVAILQKKAEIESLVLPQEVSLFLASRVSSNIRELEGSLTRIAAFSSLTRTEITLDLAKKVLRDASANGSEPVTVEDIVKAVSAHFHLKTADIKGRRRTKAVAWARQISMYLSREMTDCSFPEIGSRIGGKDHSTVMYAHDKISKAVLENEDTRKQIDSIRSTIGK
jgi:chromosomal replication initiator protein